MFIECSECRNEASLNAQSCPKCGKPVSPNIATTSAPAATVQQPAKKRGFFFYAGWAVFSVVGLFIGSAVIAGIVEGASGSSRSESSHGEVETTVKRIFATCQTQVLGHEQAEGEHINDAESTAIVQCVDALGGAYIAGKKAARD